LSMLSEIVLVLMLVGFCLLYLFLFAVKIESMIEHRAKYIGIMTDEGENEWIDYLQSEFQSLEEAPEQIPWRVERKKP
jgi:hypothetical protein